MSKSYQRFEGLRIAILTTFISGFINAYTFNTQGGVFAGAQTGNVLGMMIQLTKGHYGLGMTYLLPIVFFVLGQFFAYLGRQKTKDYYDWPHLAIHLLVALMVITAVISPFVSRYLTIALLAFFSSLQLDAFPTVRGTIYANVMMTGNVKNAAAFWIRGVMEKDTETKRQAYYTMIALFSFMVGVGLSTAITQYLAEYSLYVLLLPILLLHYFLRHEKTPR